MSDKPVLFVVNLQEGVLARAWLNDLPLHKELTTGPDSMAGGANTWLVPGENTLSLEIHRAPIAGDWTIRMMLYTVNNPNVEPMDINVIHRVEFPALFQGIPEPRRVLPYFHTSTFTPDVDIAEPAYLSSPPLFYGCDGTPELRMAVQEIHDALTSGDVDRFLRLTELKGEENERAFPGIPSATAARRSAFIRKFFTLRPRVKPLDFRLLHFEPRSSGRVAYVTGVDDEPAIHAIAEDDPQLQLRANLLLTQFAGRWQVFG